MAIDRISVFVICAVLAVFWTAFAQAQSGDTIERELTQVKGQLERDGRLLQSKTEEYVVAKLKRNLFRKLRSILERDSNFEYPFRQNNEEEAEEEEEEATTASTNSTTRPNQIIPQVANLIKAIFGGNSINITSYAQSATKFLPPSIGNQVLGVVKLLAHNPSGRWTTTTTSTAPPTKATNPPIKIIRVTPLNQTRSTNNIVKSNSVTPTPKSERATPTPSPSTPTPIILIPTGVASTTQKPRPPTPTPTPRPKTTTKLPSEDDEDEEDERSRQLQFPDLSDLTVLLGGTRRPTVNATTESASGFDVESATSGGLDLRELASSVRLGLGDLIKVMPDLFKGAREAVGLLSGIQSLLGSFGGFGN